jgi:hypothetical protein
VDLKSQSVLWAQYVDVGTNGPFSSPLVNFSGCCVHAGVLFIAAANGAIAMNVSDGRHLWTDNSGEDQPGFTPNAIVPFNADSVRPSRRR